MKVSKKFEKLLKLESIKKAQFEKISELTQIYRPIPCITDSNWPITAESECVAMDMIIFTIQGSVLYRSPPFLLRLGRHVSVSADIANHALKEEDTLRQVNH